LVACFKNEIFDKPILLVNAIVYTNSFFGKFLFAISVNSLDKLVGVVIFYLSR